MSKLISFSADTDVENMINHLRRPFGLTSDADVIQHSLRLSHLLEQRSTNGAIIFLDPQGTPLQLKLSANPFSSIMSQNSRLKDIHRGQRGFILCNGESVKHQDISILKDEIVMTVSSGYLHNRYDKLTPKYHCTPLFTYSPAFTKERALTWLKEMSESVVADEIFFNTSEKDLIEEAGLFSGRAVNYVDMRGKMEFPEDQRPFDLTQSIPVVQSVSIMCLMIMMYMGFKDIYLIGTDHDELKTGCYRYPFDLKATRNLDLSVNQNGEIVYKVYDSLRNISYLWDQYRVLKVLALANNINIYNATYGGMLDEFERVDLETLLGKPA